jgi:hypothetical protein
MPIVPIVTKFSPPAKSKIYMACRFTSDDRCLYFDLTAVEHKAAAACKPMVAPYFVPQLGYFKAKQQFFSFQQVAAVLEDLHHIVERHFPSRDLASVRMPGRVTRMNKQNVILRLMQYRFAMKPFSGNLNARRSAPRACLAEATALLADHGIKVDLPDERFSGTPIEANFQARLRSYQKDAVADIGDCDSGVLCAPTAFGKTAVATWLIAKRKVNTLVLVHRQQLLDQWHERLAMFLGLPANSIGQIGGGKSDRSGSIDVAVIQSLHRKDEGKDYVAEYGQVIVDECHHISPFTFEQVMKVNARYVVGLTATPTRKDGHHPIIHMQCGPIRFNMSARTIDRNDAVRTQGDPATYGFPNAGGGRFDDSGCLPLW